MIAGGGAASLACDGMVPMADGVLLPGAGSGGCACWSAAVLITPGSLSDGRLPEAAGGRLATGGQGLAGLVPRLVQRLGVPIEERQQVGRRCAARLQGGHQI